MRWQIAAVCDISSIFSCAHVIGVTFCYCLHFSVRYYCDKSFHLFCHACWKVTRLMTFTWYYYCVSCIIEIWSCVLEVGTVKFERLKCSCASSWVKIQDWVSLPALELHSSSSCSLAYVRIVSTISYILLSSSVPGQVH